MLSSVWNWLTAEQGYTPHGFCLVWDPALVWIHVVSDALIALAYFSIPAVLFIAARRRPDMNPHGVLYLFSAFIIACGVTHLFGIATMWSALYAAEGIGKVITATISVITAILLWPLLPPLLNSPSRAELKKAHSDLEALNENLERMVADRTAALQETSQKLEAALAQAKQSAQERTLFFATMNHELRTPLNAIVGFTDMLETMWDKLPEDRRRDYLSDIRAAGLRLNGLVTEILEIERLKESPRAAKEGVRFSLAEAAGNAVKMLEGPIGASQARITLDIPGDIELSGFPQDFERILTNCLSNSIKYCDRQPEIEVTARITPDNRARIIVADNGIGIPTKSLREIFEPFRRFHEQSHPDIPGTGLGLPLIRELTGQFGGTVSYQSTEGKGTTAIFTFPLCEAREPAPAAGAAVSPALPA